MHDPALAAVLCAIVPGVEQFYNSRVLAGILWLIVTPGLFRSCSRLGSATDGGGHASRRLA